MTPQVIIIVPVHNALDSLKTLINCLPDSIPSDICYSVLFIDDCSANDTMQFLKETIVKYCNLNWQYIRNSSQQLFTRTVNRGIRATEPNIPYICEINTDVILKFGWLNKMLDIMNNDSSVGVCGYDCADGTEHEYITQDIKDRFITGHCIMMRRTALEQVGILMETDVGENNSLCPECPLGQAHIGSDRILSWKMVDAGWKMVRIGLPLIEHGTGPSWGRDLSYLFKYDKKLLWTGKDTI